jgi:type I restriction enzyme S subunit
MKAENLRVEAEFMNRYPAYKYSEIEWLGEIPEHWTVKRLRHISPFITVGVVVSPSSYVTDYGVPFLFGSEITDRGINIQKSRRIPQEISDSELRKTRLEAGDLVTVRVGYPGMTAVVPPELEGANCASIMLVRKSNTFDSFWLCYAMNSRVGRYQVEQVQYGAAQKQFNISHAVNFMFPVPPLSEQRAIAQYLDRQTAKIDALITAKQRLLKLLTEKRRALITHAVTRGLNPDAPLRRSGIEFVEKIPEHWKVINLKFLGEVRTGVAKGRDLGNRETVHVPYLRVANVQDGYIDLSDVADIQVLPEEISSFSLRKGDVLMNEGGDADKLGRGAVWDGSIDPCLHQNHVFAVRCHSIEPDWLTTVTGSDYAKAYFESRSKQSTNLASISATNIREFPVVVPPQQEQKDIIEYLEQTISKLDELQAITKNIIELLYESRVALVSAAVTGKVHVPA